MLDLREHKVLGIKTYNVLDDITSHWRRCQLSKQDP